ncbi:hypothetical protein BLNAU_10053 [Blattamonas nauphoetae]|uniref:Uncharacterized protein n=1 Tax=Blattamonas nauphoetae TaxID=2049346 RepID=A0ABQ9XTW0_9EUKA|nr:hypothetical protein BLNAU_10053 [Blattamonas nauphoetae]
MTQNLPQQVESTQNTLISLTRVVQSLKTRRKQLQQEIEDLLKQESHQKQKLLSSDAKKRDKETELSELKQKTIIIQQKEADTRRKCLEVQKTLTQFSLASASLSDSITALSTQTDNFVQQTREVEYKSEIIRKDVVDRRRRCQELENQINAIRGIHESYEQLYSNIDSEDGLNTSRSSFRNSPLSSRARLATLVTHRSTASLGSPVGQKKGKKKKSLTRSATDSRMKNQH